MVALCGRKPTTIDTPKRKEMRDKMFAKKFEDTSNAYLAEIRKAAMIEYRQAGADDSNAEDGSGRKKGRRN
jgi:peptidyl-prolyl cis-trans isomerase SurA